MTSPGGRRKLQQTSRLSPTPSPLKKCATTPNASRARHKTPDQEDQGIEDEDEDEETLQLRLQAIEAKLKLKKLQSKKAKEIGSNSENEDVDRNSTSNVASGHLARDSQRVKSGLVKSKSTTDVQVPLSPDKRRTTVVKEQKSPGRVLLGIDKGLTGRNVSLRRAPSLRANEDPFANPTSNAGSTPGNTLSRRTNIERNSERPVGKSFNERIAESRDREAREKERRERVEHLRRQRSKGFGVQETEIEKYKKASLEEQLESRDGQSKKVETGFSREDVLRAVNRAPSGLIQRNRAVSGTLGSQTGRKNTSEMFARPRSSASDQNYPRERPDSQASASLSDNSRSSTPAGDASLFEPYSSSNLSRRILPHSFVKRTMEEKRPATIPDLLAKVKAPDFELPEEFQTGDLVVFATIASKSQPFNHKERTRDQNVPEQTSQQKAEETRENDNGKYMAFTLTDLKWTLDLFLFSTAYTRWSKLTPGTLVAILNPDIMPPPKHKLDTGRWSLTLNSSEDTVLEIGTNKDLGWCKSVKKDGRQCTDWVDKRKTEYCEFHVDAGVERIRQGRMETQGMGMGFAPGGKKSGRQGFFGSGRRGGGGGSGSWDRANTKDDGLLKEGKQYDRSAHSTYFMAPGIHGGRSAASLLDADEHGDRGGRQERIRKALAEKEKEREVARKLGSIGSGAGADYLRGQKNKGKEKENARKDDLQGDDSDLEAETATTASRDAASLGLKGNKAGDAMLSPLKRKRSDTPGGTKKKTRFVTAKGIREAGRDSLPGPTEIELDDGLDIV